jgi:hypothetical protein
MRTSNNVNISEINVIPTAQKRQSKSASRFGDENFQTILSKRADFSKREIGSPRDLTTPARPSRTCATPQEAPAQRALEVENPRPIKELNTTDFLNNLMQRKIRR